MQRDLDVQFILREAREAFTRFTQTRDSALASALASASRKPRIAVMKFTRARKNARSETLVKSQTVNQFHFERLVALAALAALA